MALSAGNIYVGVKGDLNPLDKALKAAQAQSEVASKKIKSAFEKIESSAKRTAKAVTSGLGGAISGLAVGALITQAIELADTYTLLESRIGLVIGSAQSLIKTQEDLFAISQNTRVSYETTVEIFTRLARATRDVGLSQEDMLQVTEALNKAVIVSGATTIEASNALIQLSQGLASNRLGGEELRSVMEQIPRVAQMIADGLRVDIGEFREMSKQGKLTAEVVTKALLSQADVINNEFAQIPITVGQAWTVIYNSIGRAVDIINKSTGATENLAKSMIWFSEVIDNNAEGMARFIELTISGLMTIAKIAAAGGALYALPIIITKAHEAFVVLQLTLFKVQAGVIGFNTSLFGTSVAAELAAGSLSKMKLAGFALFALFAGWQLGKWANDNFEEVRLAGLATVAQLDESWIKFKFNFLQLWIDIKFGAIGAADAIKTKVAGIFDELAESMSGISVTVKNPFGDDFTIGLDSASEKLAEVAAGLKASSTATADQEEATDALRKKMAKAIEIHEGTVKILIQQKEWTKKVTDSDAKAGESADAKAWKTAAANMVIIDSSEETALAVTAANKTMYEDLGDMGEDYQNILFDELDAQYEKYEALGADTLLLDQWYFSERLKVSEKFSDDTTALQDAVTAANKTMYEDLGDMGDDYKALLSDQLDAQYAKYEKIVDDKVLLDKWYDNEKRELDKAFVDDTVTWQGTISDAVTTSAEAGATAWITGEDAKVAVSKAAADTLTQYALDAAQEPLKKGLYNLLGDQLGAWIGLGAGESSVEGSTWQERLSNGAKYLAQAGAIILAGKAVGSALYADGGWVGSHPGGGPINQGSGVRDDVFLGLSNGGSVANMAMGGEYVIPKTQTAKYFPLLDAIRRDDFADGGPVDGPVGDPVRLAHDMNGGGFSTFFTTWMDTGNYKQGIKDAVIYYVTTAAAMTASKEWGGDILGFAEGGVTGVANFAEGGPTYNQYDASGVDTNLTRQINEWIKSWTGDLGFLIDPFGIAELTDDAINILNGWIGDLTESTNLSSGSGGDFFKGIWDIEVPVWLDRGMISTSIDTVDRLLIPFTTDILTPGKGHDIPGAIEYQFGDALEESVEQGVKGLLGLDLDEDWDDIVKNLFDPFGWFHNGSSFVGATGPAIIEKGERIFSAPENQEIMDILRSEGKGGGEVNINVTPLITVKIGDDEVTDMVEVIAENVIIDREDRGLNNTGIRVRT